MAGEKIARTVTRRLEVQPGQAVAVAVEDPALAQALASLLESAGARVADEGPADAGVVEVPALEGPLVPERVVALVGAVAPGGRVVVVAREGAGFRSVESFAEQWRPCLDLAKAHGELVEGAAVVSGPRRPGLSAEERKRLRGLGHALEPTVLVGRGGLTADVVAATRDALLRHGLVKAKLTPQADLDKDAAARALAWATGAQLAQRIGKVALLYRPDAPLDPPQKRSGRR